MGTNFLQLTADEEKAMNEISDEGVNRKMALEQNLPSTNTQKTKALELAIQTIEKQFGRGSIMRLGTGQSLHEGITAIPTGSLSLDLALGIGGIPKGRVIEIYGPESSGKTTLALTAIAECQKQGGTAAFIDAEHALDVDYARKLGVDVDNMLISQPDTGEQALEIVDMLIKSSAVDILVVDSVAALVPRAELEGEMGDATMGAQARLMSQALRKLTGSINKSKSTVVFINQVRMKIGVMFGNPETTTGGNALKFYASVRMDVRRIAAIKSGDEVVGNRTRVKVVKNKVSPPFKEVEFDILYGKGICKEGDLLDLGVNLGLIEKSGTWYSYNGERLGQGRDAARDFFKANPKLIQEVREKVLKAKGIQAGGGLMPVSPAPEAPAKEEKKADKADSKAPALAASAKGKKIQ
jgi:recombination protein RecA